MSCGLCVVFAGVVFLLRPFCCYRDCFVVTVTVTVVVVAVGFLLM